MQTSDRLLALSDSSNGVQSQEADSENQELCMPAAADIIQLNEKATSQLAEIVRRGHEEGQDDAEIDAVRCVLALYSLPRSNVVVDGRLCLRKCCRIVL